MPESVIRFASKVVIHAGTFGVSAVLSTKDGELAAVARSCAHPEDRSADQFKSASPLDLDKGKHRANQTCRLFCLTRVPPLQEWKSRGNFNAIAAEGEVVVLAEAPVAGENHQPPLWWLVAEPSKKLIVASALAAFEQSLLRIN